MHTQDNTKREDLLRLFCFSTPKNRWKSLWIPWVVKTRNRLHLIYRLFGRSLLEIQRAASALSTIIWVFTKKLRQRFRKPGLSKGFFSRGRQSKGVVAHFSSYCCKYLFTFKLNVMLRWTIIFLIVAIIAAIFGFGGIASGAASIAKILFFIFLVLFVLSLIFGRRTTDV